MANDREEDKVTLLQARATQNRRLMPSPRPVAKSPGHGSLSSEHLRPFQEQVIEPLPDVDVHVDGKQRASHLPTLAKACHLGAPARCLQVDNVAIGKMLKAFPISLSRTCRSRTQCPPACSFITVRTMMSPDQGVCYLKTISGVFPLPHPPLQ